MRAQARCHVGLSATLDLSRPVIWLQAGGKEGTANPGSPRSRQQQMQPNIKAAEF
jgi:hypothetical protein